MHFIQARYIAVVSVCLIVLYVILALWTPVLLYQLLALLLAGPSRAVGRAPDS